MSDIEIAITLSPFWLPILLVISSTWVFKQVKLYRRRQQVFSRQRVTKEIARVRQLIEVAESGRRSLTRW